MMVVVIGGAAAPRQADPQLPRRSQPGLPPRPVGGLDPEIALPGGDGFENRAKSERQAHQRRVKVEGVRRLVWADDFDPGLPLLEQTDQGSLVTDRMTFAPAA